MGACSIAHLRDRPVQHDGSNARRTSPNERAAIATAGRATVRASRPKSVFMICPLARLTNSTLGRSDCAPDAAGSALLSLRRVGRGTRRRVGIGCAGVPVHQGRTSGDRRAARRKRRGHRSVAASPPGVRADGRSRARTGRRSSPAPALAVQGLGVWRGSRGADRKHQLSIGLPTTCHPITHAPMSSPAAQIGSKPGVNCMNRWFKVRVNLIRETS